MLKILLALLVVSLTVALWLLRDTLSLPGWAIAWATIAAIVLLVTLVTLEILQRRRRRRDAQRQVERSPFFVTVANLRSRCEHAVESLRTQGADDLPWVLLLGPHAAGKTAAIRSCGVGFREGLGPERIIAGGDVTPTENVQFFASERVVFIDTAGRYLCDTPDHDDRREWLELLTILHTLRPDRPLSGVVVAVAATTFTSEIDPAQLGHGLRRRLDDIQREFTTSVPVHVLVTRIDELAGVQRLLASDTSDRFGFTVELSGAGASKARRVAELPLAELALAVERRAFAHIERAATPEERGELYRGPAHFRRLTDAAITLVGALFPDHGEHDAPMWRGLWFASAGSTTPTPAADPELLHIARDYGDPPQSGAGLPPALARPAFLGGLFGAVLPEDRWVAAWTRKHRGQQRLRHGLRVALLAAAALLAMNVTLGATEANHRLLGETTASVDALTPAAAPVQTGRPLRPQHLAPIQTLHSILRDHRDNGAPWSLRFGLYQGGALVEDVERAYFTHARDRLLAPLVARARTLLDRVLAQHHDGSAPIPVDQFWAATDALHLYLLLTRPGTDNVVTLGDQGQHTWLAAYLPQAWNDALLLAPREQAQAKIVAIRWIDELPRRPDDLAERDPILVEGVRQILRRTIRGQMWADELASRPIAGTSPITLAAIAGGHAWIAAKENRRVEAAYTRQGWAHVSSQITCPAPPLERYLAAALVIDGRPCSDERRSLHTEYFKRYADSWSHFIDDIYVREPDGYKEIESQILDMTAPGTNVLGTLFATVATNLELPEIVDASALFKSSAGSGASPASLQRDFKPFYSYGHAVGDAPPPLANYINLLARVAHPLGVYNKERGAENLTQARENAKQVHELINNTHLTQIDRRWVKDLQGLLEPPIRGLLDAVARETLDEVSRRWCNEVVIPFDTMRPCYPFTPGAICDVSRDEVTGLFQPQSGKLWQLYTDALARFFPFEGDRYALASQGYNSRVKLNPRVATFLTHAREFHEVLFPHGAAEPAFSFAVQFKPMPSAASIALTVDGATVRYTNNNRDRFQPLAWPAPGGQSGARLEAVIRNGTARAGDDGDWGLFRLLEKGDISRKDRLIVARIKFNDTADVAELRINPTEGAGNPLFGKVRTAGTSDPEPGLMGIFREHYLSPPRFLFVGGMACHTLSTTNPTP